MLHAVRNLQLDAVCKQTPLYRFLDLNGKTVLWYWNFSIYLFCLYTGVDVMSTPFLCHAIIRK